MPETLILRHASMKSGTPEDVVARGLAAVFGPGPANLPPDVVTFTEASGSVGRAIRTAAKAAGYTLAAPGDCMLAVRPIHRVTDAGYRHVVDARHGMPSGNHADLGVNWINVETCEGNRAAFHVQHWLTGYELDSHPGPESPREAKHILQTRAMIEEVQSRSLGRRLAFWSGDTNVDAEADQGLDPDAPHALMSAAGLRHIYGDLGLFPPTLGPSRTIDLIGRDDSDKRVSPVRLHVFPRHPISDHRMVEAQYSIVLPACPTCGQPWPDDRPFPRNITH